MSSHHRTSNTTTINRQGVEIPDEYKNYLNNALKNLSNFNSNMNNNPVYKNLYDTAMGKNLNYVNPYEQKQLNDNIGTTNNAIMRQFDAAGRGNSFSNLQAVTGNTDNLTNSFMLNNMNRNRAEMDAARQLYLNQMNNNTRNQLAANTALANLIRQFSANTNTSTNTQTIPGASPLDTLGGLLGRSLHLFGLGW